MTTSGKITFTDWREDYAYILGVQAYIFSYPWVYMSEIAMPGLQGLQIPLR